MLITGEEKSLKKITQNKALFELCKQYCQSKGYEEPEEENPFAKSVGFKYRFDCCWPKKKVAMEFQGGGQQGRHATFYGYNNDCIKTALANGFGWSVFPITTHQFTKGMAYTIIDMIFGGKTMQEYADALQEIAKSYRKRGVSNRAARSKPVVRSKKKPKGK